MQTTQPSRRQLLGGLLAALFGCLWSRRTEAQPANDALGDVTVTRYEYDTQGRLVVVHSFSGSLTPNPDGTYTYNPAQGCATGLSFQYEVRDDAVPATVTVRRS